jgi:hypothetical protein
LDPDVSLVDQDVEPGDILSLAPKQKKKAGRTVFPFRKESTARDKESFKLAESKSEGKVVDPKAGDAHELHSSASQTSLVWLS